MRILVAGTCQANVIRRAIVLAAEICGRKVDCRFIRVEPGSLSGQTEDLLDFIKRCDVFVWQKNHLKANSVDGLIPKSTPTITLPVVSMNWLWPFATQPHPQNRTDLPYLPSGPFPPGHSDALLNQLLKRCADPDTALAEYHRIDPTTRTDLDRLFELTRAMSLSIEQDTDIRIWHVIERDFRHKRLFWDLGHPTSELFEPLCREVLRRLPLDLDISRLDAVVERIGAAQDRAAPIHPRVAEHFSLAWYDPKMKYRQDIAGWFTFEEHWRRYAHFDVDLDAYRAAHMTMPLERLQVAEELLRGSLRRAPNNHELDYLLALNLWRQNRPADALPCVTRAAHDPDVSTNDRVHSLRCAILLRLRRDEEAVAAARQAIHISSHPAPHYEFLGRALGRLGRIQEAIAALRAAIARDCHVASCHVELGHQLRRTARPEEAATAFTAAATCEPNSPHVLATAAKQLFEIDRIAQAQSVAARWLAVRPEDAGAQELHARLSHIIGQAA
jgi:tetratricopeptide (TPR) repeat protein